MEKLDSLRQLFEQTSFARIKPDHIAWEGLRLYPDKESPIGLYIFVPEKSCLANSNIVMSEKVDMGYDALFVQELVRMYANDELRQVNGDEANA